MISGAYAVFNAMKALRAARQDPTFCGRVVIPTPDARYFNAALSLFGRQMMRRREAKSNRSHWRWMLKKTRKIYEKTGLKSDYWHPMMKEIAQEMKDRGYAMPWGYKFLFVGRFNYKSVELEKRRLIQRSWSYPRGKSTAFRPYSIPTLKTRGLPVRAWHHRKRLRTKRVE